MVLAIGNKNLVPYLINGLNFYNIANDFTINQWNTFILIENIAPALNILMEDNSEFNIGQTIIMKNLSAFNSTITTNTGYTIDGLNSITLLPQGTVKIISDGNNKSYTF